MATSDLGPLRSISPVASVWCRQVDNEAESPGYTAIPDEFPGRRETMEAIRLVGNLTINASDTHDYWDPDPSSTLSYYPNLFVYPAAGGRYTCVGRMFLSTEDRPRLGMKTLVFVTDDLTQSGAFGEMVLRALASLDGRAERPRSELKADPSVYQAVGEGFLFHRGTTEPVVAVASEQWETVGQTVMEMIRSMPASLVALGAFLVFPYFLPAAKVDLHQLTEEIPLALAVMRVPRQEAEGERHTKRMQSWESLPVSVRDLTRPPSGRSKESLPLVLQYVRDEEENRVAEVARRVDQVEGPRLAAHLSDTEHQRGRERRREMWRIGTAMETAALLLSRPKGRSVKVSAETQKRANQYLEAKPGESPLLPAAPAVGAAPTTPSPLGSPAPPSPSPSLASASASNASGTTPPPSPAASATGDSSRPAGSTGSLPTGVPQWLRPTAGITLPPEERNRVPLPTSDDPSRSPRPASPATGPSSASLLGRPPEPGAPAAPLSPPARPADGPIAWQPSANDLDARVARALQQAEARWSAELDRRLHATVESLAREPLSELSGRLSSLEQRPIPTSEEIGAAVESRLRGAMDTRLSETDRRLNETVLRPLETLVRRLEAVEGRSVPTAEAIRSEVEGHLLASLEPKLAGIDTRLAEASREAAEGWAERLRRELKAAIDELSARSGKAEEELRTSLAAQIDLEVLEAKEQGTALREELEGRMRELLDRHFAEAERRRAQETRELEQKVGLLVDGRAQELEKHLSSTLTERTERLTAASDDRISHVERRLASERDARLSELTEAHRAALGALHQRTLASVDQRLRESRAEEEQRSVTLAETVRGELDASLERRLASPEFDAGLAHRIHRAVDAARAEQGAEIAQALSQAESRIATAREEAVGQLHAVQNQLASRESDLAAIEETLRAEIDDLDRRLMVVNDHVLPLVRQTWLKVSEQEFAARAKVTEARLGSVRQELSEEIRRVEADLLQQQSDLRDRLEASVASHGRIWLNLLRQISPDGGGGIPSAANPASHRFPRRSRPMSASLPSAAESEALPSDGMPFAEDPPNPMDPELGHEFGAKDARRRPLRRA